LKIGQTFLKYCLFYNWFAFKDEIIPTTDSKKKPKKEKKKKKRKKEELSAGEEITE